MIFTGDAIFEGGAGKFLEGTPLMMHQILYRMLEYEDEAENVKLFPRNLEPTICAFYSNRSRARNISLKLNSTKPCIMKCCIE